MEIDWPGHIADADVGINWRGVDVTSGSTIIDEQTIGTECTQGEC
jgi:hypothetical protein